MVVCCSLGLVGRDEVDLVSTAAVEKPQWKKWQGKMLQKDANEKSCQNGYVKKWNRPLD